VIGLFALACGGCAETGRPQALADDEGTIEQVPSLGLVLVVHDGWGEASPDDVAQVLASAAATLLEHAPGGVAHPVSVRPCAASGRCAEAPFNTFDGVRFIVELAAIGLHWDGYAYEFAHELCHVLATSGAVAASPEPLATAWAFHERANRWFEEAICETASLFALRRMAEVWAHRPPFPNWRPYASALGEYAEARLREPARQLPKDTSLAALYADNAARLRELPVDRPFEDIVSLRLLPMFEDDPSRWEALTRLRGSDPSAWDDLGGLLATWRARVSEPHRELVDAIAHELGVAKPEP
jgi:hypothetical protein